MGQGGPKTEAGKAASSRNALRHGLLSEAPLTAAYEKPDEWQAHLRAIVESLAPRDQAEACLAERVALLHWRLRRCAAAEVEQLNRRAAELARGSEPPAVARASAAAPMRASRSRSPRSAITWVAIEAGSPPWATTPVTPGSIASTSPEPSVTTAARPQSAASTAAIP